MYYTARFRNGKHTYHAYTEAYDRKEAVNCIRDELIGEEKDDIMECIWEISEQEYMDGYKAFHNGERV